MEEYPASIEVGVGDTRLLMTLTDEQLRQLARYIWDYSASGGNTTAFADAQLRRFKCGALSFEHQSPENCLAIVARLEAAEKALEACASVHEPHDVDYEHFELVKLKACDAWRKAAGK